MERYETLQTCADVFALSHGFGESLTLDYKEKLSGSRRDLARDVCALANTQGGVLVVGVKDPKPEGSPPKDPRDFVGVPVEADLVRKVESQLIDAISPRVFPRVKTTDTFRPDGDERYFLLIEVPASSQLHQVTVERDFKFYRRAEYQNRPMTTDEVQLRMEAILSGRRGMEALFEDEIARLEEIMDGPYIALLAVPTIGHRLAADPAEPNIRQEIEQLAMSGRHGTGRLVQSGVRFEPTGDGAHVTQQYHTAAVATECRVRRNSFVTYAQAQEAIDRHEAKILVSRHSPADSLWREEEKERHWVIEQQATEHAKWGRPSSVVSPVVAVRVRPKFLHDNVANFLDLIRGVYGFGGWRGSIRLEAVVSGRRPFFPAARAKLHPVIDWLVLAETTQARAGIEFDYESMELRREDLADELMRGLARNFGMDQFPD